jgi:hypothetical protein
LGGEVEEEEMDERVKCPICNKYHEPTENHDSTTKAKACSHGGIVVYIAHQCPICLEDGGHALWSLGLHSRLSRTWWISGKKNQRTSVESLNEEIRMDLVRFMTRVNILGMVGRMDPARVRQQVNCPSLVRRDNGAGKDDSDDDSMPPLAARNDDDDNAS